LLRDAVIPEAELLMKPRYLLAFLFLLLLVQRPTGMQASANSSARQRFLGAWRLVSYQNISPQGQASYDPSVGPHGVGYLIYDPTGHMCVGLMNPERPQWREPKDPTPQEKIQLFDTFYAYCGKYEVHEADHVMMHLPELASTPDYVASRQPRPYTFDGDRLTFAGKNPPGEAGGGTYVIVWEKVE
jgi:hypothetical protein